MSSNNAPCDETPGGHSGPVYQFSTFGLLAVLTTVSLVLAAYFGIGRAFGMTNADMLQHGMRFIHIVPMLAVWAIGLIIALHRRRRDGRRSLLLVVAFGGLILTALASAVAQMVLIYMLNTGAISNPSVPFGVLSILSILLNIIWWILVLVALFAFPIAASRHDEQ